MAGSSAFEWLCTALEESTTLERLEARGTVRIALKEAGLEPRTVAFEQPEKAALDADEPVAQFFDDLVVARGGHRIDAAANVLGCLGDILGEALNGILPRIIDIALGAGADILGLGLGADPAILHLGEIGLDLGKARIGQRIILRRARRLDGDALAGRRGGSVRVGGIVFGAHDTVR